MLLSTTTVVPFRVVSRRFVFPEMGIRPRNDQNMRIPNDRPDVDNDEYVYGMLTQFYGQLLSVSQVPKEGNFLSFGGHYYLDFKAERERASPCASLV